MTKYRIMQRPRYTKAGCYIYEIQRKGFFGWTDAEPSNIHLTLQEAEARVRELQSAPPLERFRVVKEFD